MPTCEKESSKVINFGFKYTTYTYIFVHTGDSASDITRCLTQQFILYCIIYIIYIILYLKVGGDLIVLHKYYYIRNEDTPRKH